MSSRAIMFNLILKLVWLRHPSFSSFILGREESQLFFFYIGRGRNFYSPPDVKEEKLGWRRQTIKSSPPGQVHGDYNTI